MSDRPKDVFSWSKEDLLSYIEETNPAEVSRPDERALLEAIKTVEEGLGFSTEEVLDLFLAEGCGLTHYRVDHPEPGIRYKGYITLGPAKDQIEFPPKNLVSEYTLTLKDEYKRYAQYLDRKREERRSTSPKVNQ